MKSFAKAIWTSAIVAALCGPARAGLIWDQQPLDTGGPGADTDFFNDSNQRVWQLVADNFQLSSAASIGQVRWWGLYGGNLTGDPFPPSGPETMRLRFYAPRPGDGLPSEVLYEEDVTGFTRSATGRIIRTPIPHPEYVFDADLSIPFDAESGQLYWLEIVQLGDSSSVFRWEYSLSSLDDRYVFFNTRVTDWTYSALPNTDVAFQLLAVPEPEHLALIMVLACANAIRLRGR